MIMSSSQRSTPAPFLVKTYQLVDDSSTDDVISWTEKGDTFVVWKNAEFAKDLLPKYFKHNNFSSFVRQLNTYGFRKIVPDKWEFANDNFKRGHKDLLSDIRRRKVAATPPVPAASQVQRANPAGPSSSQSNSSNDPGATSSKNSAGSVEDHHHQMASTASKLAVVTDENRQLKRQNEMLSSELAETKKRCVDLVSLLSGCLKVGPDQIDRIMRQGISCAPGSRDSILIGDPAGSDRDEDGAGDPGSLKLFGIWLKDEGKNEGKSVENEESIRFTVPHVKENKAPGVHG